MSHAFHYTPFPQIGKARFGLCYCPLPSDGMLLRCDALSARFEARSDQVHCTSWLSNDGDGKFCGSGPDAYN
jgi:hypothetical protein